MKKTTQLVVMSLLALLAIDITLIAQATNAVPALPGLTPEGGVDVVNLINLTILALTPIVTQAIKKVLPKLPDFSLNILAPALGALIGAGLHAAGVSVATGWGAAIWGGLGTWLYELSANIKDYVASKSTPAGDSTSGG